MLFFSLAAELVKWTPIGDQYVVCCGDTINVYDVQVTTTQNVLIFDEPGVNLSPKTIQ